MAMVSFMATVVNGAGVEDITMLTGDEINSPSSYLVFLNGLIVGVHIRPHAFVKQVASDSLMSPYMLLTILIHCRFVDYDAEVA
jgi:hypothetical protein